MTDLCEMWKLDVQAAIASAQEALADPSTIGVLVITMQVDEVNGCDPQIAGATAPGVRAEAAQAAIFVCGHKLAAQAKDLLALAS